MPAPMRWCERWRRVAALICWPTRPFSHQLRDQRAVARYGGLTGAPDESSARRRKKGLARAGNARMRRTMIPIGLAFLIFQKDSALARWYWQRTADHRGTTCKR